MDKLSPPIEQPAMEPSICIQTTTPDQPVTEEPDVEPSNQVSSDQPSCSKLPSQSSQTSTTAAGQ